MLATLITSLVLSGYTAFTQTFIELQVEIDPEEIEVDRLPRGDFDDVVAASLLGYFPEVDAEDRAAVRRVTSILSDGAQFALRDRVVANPGLIGRTITLEVPVSDPYDQLMKGSIDRDTPEVNRRLKDDEIAAFDRLVEAGAISTELNTGLITNADSRFPELAGLKGALIGSFWALLVCFLISFPLGIGAAIYLEEFAPKNRITDVIEVNINNLAAVPSVVFGLLALAVFLGWFGLPRSAPFVGGLTLALMTLPTIIIAARALAEGGAALDPRGGAGGGGVEAPDGVPPRAAAGDAGHPDGDDHRAGAGAGGDGAVAADRDERVHHVGAGLAVRRRHGVADADLHLGGQPRARVREPDVGGDPGAAGVFGDDERAGGLFAPAPGAAVVSAAGRPRPRERATRGAP